MYPGSTGRIPNWYNLERLHIQKHLCYFVNRIPFGR